MSAFSAALSAALEAVRCPACSVDWSVAPADAATDAVPRQLPPCGHAVCLGCYAKLHQAAVGEGGRGGGGGGGVACPACGIACRLRPERLPPDPGVAGLLALLPRLRRQRQPRPPAQPAQRREQPTVRLLDLSAASYAPAYLAERRALLCLRRDCNNQQLEAADPDTGRHLAGLPLSGLREPRTLTGVCVCRRSDAGGPPLLLLSDRYRDRLHVADLTGRCLQTVDAGRGARPGAAWADGEVALVPARDGKEMLVLTWEGGKLVRAGAVSAVSGQQLSGFRSVVCVDLGDGEGNGGVGRQQQLVLLLHSGGISMLDRRHLMRRLQRAAAASGGAVADAPACEVPADGTLAPADFGLAECTAMTEGSSGDGGWIGGGRGDGNLSSGSILFLAGRESPECGPSRPPLDSPSHGIRILRPDPAGASGGSGWLLVASVGCRCRCSRCVFGCESCVHQPRLPVDGMAYDEREGRLFACRRGSRQAQVVQLLSRDF